MRNVVQLYGATCFEKEISKQVSKKIFRQSLFNFLLQLTKPFTSTNNSREILACRRQVSSREQEKLNGGEQESTRVGYAKTIAKESTLEVEEEEEDKILAMKVEGVRARGRSEN